MSTFDREFSSAKIPARLCELLGRSIRCDCGRTHSVEMQGAVLRSGAIEEVVPWAREVSRAGTVGVVFDRRTLQVAGERVCALLRSDGRTPREVRLEDGAGGRPHADEATVALVERALAGCDVAVAVGSGTINDLVKLASFRIGRPYLVVATAPSMNGYTSAIAAISQGGLKRTIDCHQPFAVIADLDVLVAAPPELVAAGVGDLESKPTATADFRLAAWVRGEWWCPAPETVVLEAERRVADAASDIGRGDREALGLLVEALLLSGISMKLAGSSAPASGGEHLISHYWDMCAPLEGRVEGLHGAQVGVATLVTSALYEELKQLRPEQLDIERLSRRVENLEGEEFSRLHPKWHELARAELRRKTREGEALAQELRRVRDGWEEMFSRLGESLRPARRIRDLLRAAGAPVTLGGLGLEAGHMQRAWRAARHIRSRFTVLDLAWELGVLEELQGPVLGRSGCLLF